MAKLAVEGRKEVAIHRKLFGGYNSTVFVMVNFMSQLAWAKGCPDSCLNIISLCVCGDVSGKDEHLNQQTK